MQNTSQTTKTLFILAVFMAGAITLVAQNDTSKVQPQAKQMKEVVVSASKPVLQMKNDRISMNVAQGPLAAGENIYETIKRMPGVMEQGGLQFRGKSVLVYINDRPSVLTGDDLATYLSAMPANTVERVDIITNPSARYDAAGKTIINIILAKNKNFGTSGTLNAGAGAGRYARYNGGFTLSHRRQNINLYGGADAAHTQTYADVHSLRFINAGNSITEDQHSVSDNNSYSFKMGMDYDVTKNSSIGFLIKGVGAARTKDIANRSLLQYFSGSNDSVSTVATASAVALVAPSINLYYKTSTGKNKGQLSLNADLYQFNKKGDDGFTTRYYDASGKEYQPSYLLRDKARTGITVRSFSADYSFAAKKINYEMGVKTLFTTTDNDAGWERFNNSQWVNDAGKSNHFIYSENINAAYVSMSKTIKKISLQLGLRAEQTNAEGHSVTLDRKDRNSYLNFFPSIDIAYNASAKQQFSLAYRRKIERFGFNIVNPFIVYQSQYSYSQGNPGIKPSFSDNFELGWSFNNNWLVSASYEYYTSVLADIYKKSPDGQAMVSTYDNVSSANQVSMSVSYTKSFFKRKLTTSNTAMGLYAKYNAPAGSELGKRGIAGYFMSNNTWVMGKGWKAELGLTAISSLKMAALNIGARFAMNAGIAKTVLKGNGTLTLNVTDILNTSKQNFSVSSYGVASTTRDNTETRFVKASLSWRFGNKNVKAARARKNAIEEVQSRMGN